MSNQPGNSSLIPSSRLLRRKRLLPLQEFLEKQSTVKVSTISGYGEEPENSLLESWFPSLLWEPESYSYDIKDESTSSADTAPLKNYGLDNDDISGKETLTTPTIRFKGVSYEQSQSSVKQSDISGAASNAGFVAIGNIAGYTFRYANNILIQRALGVGLFGLYTLGMAVVTLVSSLFNLGLDDAMIRFTSIYRGRRQPNLLRGLTIFCTALAGVAGLIAALLVIYFAPVLAAFEKKPAIAPLLVLLAPTIPLTCLMTIWSSGLQGFKDFKKRVFLSRILLPIVGFVLLGIAFLFFRNITGIIVMTLVGTVVGTAGNLYFLFFRIARLGHTHETKSLSRTEEYAFKEWFGFAAPNILTNIMNTILDSIDTLLLGYFAIPSVEIGLYGAAIKVTSLIALPLQSIGTMFAPTIAEFYSRGEKRKLDEMFKVVTKWTITFSLPIFGITTLFSVPLLALSGDKFMPAWPLVIAFSIGGLVNAGTGSVGYMLLMTGHARVSFLNSLVAVAVNVVLGLILTPRFGAMGTAVATGLALSVVNLLRLLQVRLLVKMQPYRWDTLKPFGAWAISSLVVGALLYLLSFTNISAPLFHVHLSVQLLLIPVFIGMYVWLLILFKISPEDAIVLDRLNKKFKFRRAKK